MKQTNQNIPIIFARDGPLKGDNWVVEKELIIGARYGL